MLFTYVWAIARPEYDPYLKAANEARAAVVADAWRAVRQALGRLTRRRTDRRAPLAAAGEGR